VDVQKYDIKSLRRHVGYVAQETFLFSETIANNTPCDGRTPP
jgi:ABC-type multidrug transport system fused ATPase/permease subunit